MGDQVTLFHGGAYEITPAKEPEAGIVVEVFDMEEDASSVAPMTPAEWDAFVAAGARALGRPSSTPLSVMLYRLAKAADAAGDDENTCERATHSHGRARGLEEAASIVALDEAAMAREQGPTVPRTAVAAVVAEIDALECADEDAILSIRRSLAALLAPAPKEPGYAER